MPEVLEFVDAPRGGAGLSRHQLPRPFHSHQDSPHLRDLVRPGQHRHLQVAYRKRARKYREQYQTTTTHLATDSPALRDPSPTVVLIPGLGMFSFGKNKTEARIAGEFYTNAIHVIEGAAILAEGKSPRPFRNAAPGHGASAVQSPSQLRRSSPFEAFRIEYWAMEEAKIRRQPPEKELSRRIALIVGGGSGIGREVALLAAARGAHVMVADPKWPRPNRR